MDAEHRAIMTKTRELIELTRREISQLREELQLAWNSVEQSQKLLSRVERQRRLSPFSKLPHHLARIRTEPMAFKPNYRRDRAERQRAACAAG